VTARRKLLIALGASLLAGPFGSFAQQPGKIWRIGFLSSVSRPTTSGSDNPFGAFLQGMRELGYVEGKNVVIDWRFADGRVEDLPGLAAELIQSKVDVILAAGTPATSAAQKATATIPIVMGPVGDPIGSGFVKSLARPGGNITGISNLTGDVGAKYLEILLSMVPKLSRVAVLMYPANSSHDTILKSVRAAGGKNGVEVVSMAARTPQEIENAFSMMTKDKSGAVIVAPDQYFLQQRSQIAALAIKNRLPSILNNREYAEAGGLCSYGVNVTDQYRRAATYVDKILRGAKPGDLPVEQPTEFQLFINRKTAKALGLTIPQSLLISADKVIE
jgi:putative ABC transport system substrate-binding protein